MAVGMEDFQSIFVFKKLMTNQRWHTDVVREGWLCSSCGAR
jgi:hypothetical protein